MLLTKKLAKSAKKNCERSKFTYTIDANIKAKGTTTIAPSPPPMMAIENRRDDDNGRPTRASIVSPPGGAFLALHNDGGNAGDAVGKARGRAEDGGVDNEEMMRK